MRVLPFVIIVCALMGFERAIPVQGPDRSSTAVLGALARYEAGQYEAAVGEFDTRQVTVVQFLKAIDGWLERGDPTNGRRRAVAAAFALEISWSATRTLFGALVTVRDDGKSEPASTTTLSRGQRFVAIWVARLLQDGPVLDTVDRHLWLAAVGVAQDSLGWRSLVTEILPRARTRWPGEPRLRLAEVVARTGEQLWPLRIGNGPEGSLGTGFRDADVLNKDRLRPVVLADFRAAERELEGLLGETAEVAAEAALRIGYLKLHRRDWEGALRQLVDARTRLTEPTLLACADYLTGWVLEQLGQTSDAIVAYQRAIAIAPEMRMLATRLSALLFLKNHREEAYAILDRALKADPAPADLLIAIDRGDARFVPGWLATIRKAMQ